MKILSNKTARRMAIWLVILSKNVHLSSFKGSLEEQVERFGKFTKEIVDFVYILCGKEGLALIESELGISSIESSREGKEDDNTQQL